MPEKYQNPALTVDAVAIRGDRVLLVRRGRPPFLGSWALPGGFVELRETVEQALVRELKEETGLEPARIRLLGVYSGPDRDPRKPTTTVAFLVRGLDGRPHGGDDAREARWVPITQAHPLAFDHAQILSDGRAALRGRGPTVTWRRPGAPARSQGRWPGRGLARARQPPIGERRCRETTRGPPRPPRSPPSRTGQRRAR